MFRQKYFSLLAVIYLTGFSFLTGCAAPNVSENIIENCRKDGGSYKKKSVQVEGFLYENRRPWNSDLQRIMEGKLNYIEYKITNNEIYNDFSIQEEGFYQFYKADKDNIFCVKVRDWEHKKYESFFNQKCIALKKINEPISRYKWIYSKSRKLKKDNRREGIVHRRSENVFVDMHSGEIIAKHTHYGYGQDCSYFSCGASGRVSVSCSDLDEFKQSYKPWYPFISLDEKPN